MGLSLFDWHKRFAQQAGWTHGLRIYLYDHAGMQSAKRVLDLGCGTGVLAKEILGQYPAEVHCLDLERIYLKLAAGHAPGARPVQADAHHLPYASGVFDISLCHYVLLWLTDPLEAVKEMARVTRLGGYVLAIAEPDYGGRIDHPDELVQLGKWQQEALRGQGADPLMGRRLSGIFTQAGLEVLESGVIAGQWKTNSSPEGRESEWAVLNDDLKAILPKETLERYRRINDAAWDRGDRVLFVPTFYTWGAKI